MIDVPEITIPLDAWARGCDGLLTAQIRINGLDLHVNAIPVERDNDGDVVAMTPLFDEYIEKVVATMGVTRAQIGTVRFRDQPYTIVATPTP